MSERLPTDQYYIRNGDNFAGRNKNEERSLRPKGVFCPSQGGPELWVIQALPNGRYKLTARGAPTTEKDKRLYALVIEDEAPQEWVITLRQTSGARALYTIEKADLSGGWITGNEDDYFQIGVRPLIVNPSNPPIFPANELWNIQPLVD